MSTIKVTCIDQTMAFTSTPVITSGGIRENQVSFEFCPLWDGYNRTVVFWRTANDPHYRVLDETNTCYIPDEVLIAEGPFFFGVFGVNADSVQRTTGVLRYNVGPGVLRADTVPLDPTPDIYVQLLAGYAQQEAAVLAATQAVNAANSALADAQEALASAEAALQQVTGDIDAMVSEQLQAALPSVLDDTFTATDKAAQSAAVGALVTSFNAALGARAQIATGSYEGTGTHGAENKTSLTFDFEPKLLVITPNEPTSSLFVAINGADYYRFWLSTYNEGEINDGSITWGATVSWYTGFNADCQFNDIGTTYYYFAIG